MFQRAGLPSSAFKLVARIALISVVESIGRNGGTIPFIQEGTTKSNKRLPIDGL